jgi:hypothetical protein
MYFFYFFILWKLKNADYMIYHILDNGYFKMVLFFIDYSLQNFHDYHNILHQIKKLEKSNLLRFRENF